MVLSHWPHVAEQVQQQVQQLVAELVEQHVASVKALLYRLTEMNVACIYCEHLHDAFFHKTAAARAIKHGHQFLYVNEL